MGKVTVILTGTAVCRFVRTMEIYEDEVAELLADEDKQSCNLDHPDASFDIESWVETTAILRESVTPLTKTLSP